MFSPGNSNKSQIQEANKHLQLLHCKVEDLERQLAEKEVLFGEREKQLSEALEFANISRDTHVRELKQHIEQQGADITMLNEKLEQKDLLIARLQHKCEVLDYIAQHRNALEEIVSVLSGVQRLEQKSKHKSSQDDQQGNILSRKTEAHGMSDSTNATNQSTAFVGSSTISTNQSYRTFDGRFSISEVEGEEEHIVEETLPDDVFSKSKSEKELYM